MADYTLRQVRCFVATAGGGRVAEVAVQVHEAPQDTLLPDFESGRIMAGRRAQARPTRLIEAFLAFCRGYFADLAGARSRTRVSHSPSG